MRAGGKALYRTVRENSGFRGNRVGIQIQPSSDDGRTLCIVISQSGETIDTLAALKEAKRLGAQSIAVTNSIGSSIARETDVAIYTLAGPEIAVASTKAYTTQLVSL